jgi:8-oxo-dGTP pyrophosphatase MutT (NUDIX family)
MIAYFWLCIVAVLFINAWKSWACQGRVPIGMVPVSILNLPAGMLDEEKETVAGIAVKEMEEECGIEVRSSD